MRLRLLIVLLVAVPLLPARADGETTRVDGAHFRLILHFEGKGLEKRALAGVEELWAEAAKLYGLPKGPLRKKLEVNLYRDRTAYEVSEEKLAGGKFRRNQAFAHYDTVTAHVALQPPVTDAVLAAVGVPELTRSLLVHEAAHLIRYSTMPNYRSHPDWLADGAATYLKHRVLSGDRPEAHPLASTNVIRVQKLLEEGGLPTPSAILDDGIGDLPFYRRYSVRWLFFRFLMEKHGAAVRETLKRTRRLGGGAKLPGKVKALLAERIGTTGVRALDKTWPAYVSALEPEWDQVWRNLSGDPKRRVQIAFPDANAVVWRTAAVGRSDFSISGTATILDNARHQLNLLLDRNDAGFVCVALSADLGVTLFDYRSKEDRWNRLRFVARKGLKIGEPFRFELRVTGNRLRLRIDDDSVLDEKIEGRTLEGPWGLGALAGSAGIWEGLSLK